MHQGCSITYRVFDAGEKGAGLKAAEAIEAGSLVVEYIGTVTVATHRHYGQPMYFQLDAAH